MSGSQQLLLGGSPAGYQIERSLRFNSADSAYLNRTPGSAGNRKTWTWSGWVKRSALNSSGESALFIVGTSLAEGTYFNIAFSSDKFVCGTGAGELRRTTAVYRDVSAWYHLVVALDTTQATATNRVKMYVNGVEVTAFDTNVNPAQNADLAVNSTVTHNIGRNTFNSSNHYNGYMTEMYLIDGQALTPSSFGQTNASTGVWEPIRYTGTYGTNGFYLNFSDNSNTTAATLGKDSSGNGNNWTPNNFSVTAGAGNDSLVDTPTSYGTDTGAGGEVRGNYITFNQLLNGLNYNSGSSILNGNLQATTNSQLYKTAFLNIGITSGKWYCEFTWTAIGANAGAYVGIAQGSGEPQTVLTDATYPYIGSTANSYGYRSYDGQLQGPNDLTASYGNSYATNDVIGVALDMDSGKVWFSKNGTWQNSGSPTGGTNAAKTGLTDIVFIGASYYDTNDSVYVNTGQRPFAYTAPSGFKALCTQNLPTPTIGATSTTQAGKYMNVVLYTGDGNNGRSITGVGFQTDFNWTKSRSSGSYFHQLSDAVRGFDKYLYSNATNAEGTDATNHIQSVNSDGYVINSGASFNANTVTYVAWNWNAGGSNATNTSGTITSTVRANTTAGFSIVTYTGTGSAGTVGHGLGVAPSMIIVKDRDQVNSWGVYHDAIGNTKILFLESTSASQTSSTAWNNTSPTSTVFTIGATGTTNQNTKKFVAYCFATVAGYSAFGSYTGNGSTDGPFVYTGFRPRFILIKCSSNADYWWLKDSARNTYNLADLRLAPNFSDAEANDASLNGADFLSNGFKLRGTDTTTNGSTRTYIYAAFAENPFKYSLAR